MTSGVKEKLRQDCLYICSLCDYYRDLDIDSFSIMRLSLVHSLAETIAKHLS